MEHELNPSAGAGILSLRAFDYDLPSALADLVDNSITAGAGKIDILTEWAEKDSWLAVIDNGCGMSEEVLHEAMRLGSTSPDEVREPHDLGRFGLGLKTASIWACRLLTVISKTKGGEVVTRTWDVDHVVKRNKWVILDKIEGDLAKRLRDKIDEMESGTAVIWRKMDTLYKGGRKEEVRSKESYLADFGRARAMLGMTFHRFLERKEKPVQIRTGGGPIQPWNPGIARPAPESTHKTLLAFHGATVSMATHVMPYAKRFANQTDFDAAGGPNGWNAHQGFYIYRNDRLIVAGGWLNLFQPADHYKLARVIVDIPNSLDGHLGISVTKTKVRLPEGLRVTLEQEAKAVRTRSVEVYRNRGRKVAMAANANSNLVLPWDKRERDGQFYYKLNRKHPLLMAARKEASGSRAFDAFLELVEQSIPYADIIIANGERPDSLPAPYEDASTADRLKSLKAVYAVYLEIAGSRQEALAMLKSTAPYSSFSDELSKL